MSRVTVMCRGVGVVLLSRALLWLAFTAVCPSPVTAQSQLPLVQGDRIRMTASGSPSHKAECVGRYMEVRQDTLAAQCWLSGRRTWEEFNVPLQSIDRLEISQGKKSNVGKGALIGALAGAGFGLAVGIGAAAEDDGWFDYGAEVIPLAMLGGAFWGTAFGLVIGALTPGEKWAEIPLDAIRTRSPSVTGGVVGLRVTVALP